MKSWSGSLAVDSRGDPEDKGPPAGVVGGAVGASADTAARVSSGDGEGASVAMVTSV